MKNLDRVTLLRIIGLVHHFGDRVPIQALSTFVDAIPEDVLGEMIDMDVDVLEALGREHSKGDVK